MRRKALDFIGLNYYSRQLVDMSRWGFSNVFMDVCQKNHHPVPKNTLGWDIYPEGLYSLLMQLKAYDFPVMITENGMCTAEDALRWEFIQKHLKNIHLAMKEGAQVIGYLYWSLMDNFEWDKGFGPRFGLIDIDYRTHARTLRESAVQYSRVCQSGILEA